ncbi:unnamed protein product [Adineta ricciae]|uniref:Uncharacterized protein n=1 Tax=Adineta ricciae TaxID=249248 RepID=A0A815M724_ADIRI|nr:unnamed protein product [Adineta ricciae]
MSGSQDQSVKEFCHELHSILDSRPSISKAKMMSITKAALKAMKYYKHIVMNVEKFITKCKPEYKIPGLYVIDSIIRQSRHQYGIDKDVYGPRFAKNILSTLHQVNKCSSDERPKITRVLNLWEKNAIFSTDLIRQLFEVQQYNGNIEDLSAAVVLPDDKQSGEISSSEKGLDRFRELQETLLRVSAKGDPDTTSILTEIQQITNQLLESQKKSTTVNNSGDEPSSTTTSSSNLLEPMQSSVANVLDDFDYGSDNDEDEPRRPSTTNIPSTVPVPTLPPPMQYFQPQSGILINPNHANTVAFPMPNANNIPIPMAFDPTQPPPMFFQQPLPSSMPAQQQQLPPPPQINYDRTRSTMHQAADVDLRPEDMDADKPDQHRHTHMSLSPSHRQYNRRRSRSRSQDRDSKRTRSSSNSMDRRDSATTRLQEAEKRERQRKGLPPLKEGFLVVSSRTLWLGHLPKIISEIDLRETLEPHGKIEDINNIPPRGCAFICFKERSDAARCLEKKRDFRFHGNPIKIAWGMSKGVKDRFKHYWDSEHGCTYIPYTELKDISNLQTISEGGTIDEASMPPALKSASSSQIQQPPPSMVQPPAFFPPQQSFPQHEFQTRPPTQPTVHLDGANHMPSGPTILMASSREPSVHVGVPVQMMPPGAQIIQVQQHPHGQPVQVVQHITGQMYPNSQIVHQMPYGHVIEGAPPRHTIQLQPHPTDLNGLNPQVTFAPSGGIHLLTHPSSVPTHHHLVGHTAVGTGVPLATTATIAHTLEGHSLMEFPNNRRASPPQAILRHFTEHPPPLMPTPDETLVLLSQSHPAPHQQRFAGGIIQAPASSSLPTANENNEHQNPSTFSRPLNHFQQRDGSGQPLDNNTSFPGHRGGGHPTFDSRMDARNVPRDSNRGRGSYMGGRGFNSNNNRSDQNSNNRGTFHRGGHGGGGNSSQGFRGQMRFPGRDNHRVNNEHKYSSPDRSPNHHPQSLSRHEDKYSDRYSSKSSGFSAPPTDGYSHRSIPVEALRRKDPSTSDVLAYNDSHHNSTKSSLIIDITSTNRSGHPES